MSISIQKHIIRIERDETANSKSPMWRCVCNDGDRVNIFKHTDPAKNTFALFDAAGYGATLVAMDVKAIAHWKTTPITVTLVKQSPEAKFWDVAAVAPIVDGAGPDPAFTPSLSLYRHAVQVWASYIVDPSLPVVCLDTETTGLSFDDDEIVDICVRDFWGGELFSSLINPSDKALQRFTRPGANGMSAAQVTGIDPGALQYNQNFIEAHERLSEALNGKVWVIYNASFDFVMLERMCARLHLQPFSPLAVVCAMEQFATWHGNWDAPRQRFTPVKLSEACAEMGVEIQPHHAASDVRATIDLIHKLAQLEDGDVDN